MSYTSRTTIMSNPLCHVLPLTSDSSPATCPYPNPPLTTQRKPSHSPTRATTTTTPFTSRVTASHVVQSSPYCTTTLRHSLYGTEDRVVIDPGSRIWKVGFSGEGRPRDVFYPGGKTPEPLWSLRRRPHAQKRTDYWKSSCKLAFDPYFTSMCIIPLPMAVRD